MSSTARLEAPTLRIKPGELLIEAKRYNLQTDTQIAAHIGVNAMTLYRLRRGQHAPSATFIAQTLIAFPELRFGDLFEVVATERVAS